MPRIFAVEQQRQTRLPITISKLTTDRGEGDGDRRTTPMKFGSVQQGIRSFASRPIRACEMCWFGAHSKKAAVDRVCDWVEQGQSPAPTRPAAKKR